MSSVGNLNILQEIRCSSTVLQVHQNRKTDKITNETEKNLSLILEILARAHFPE